jgi:3-deoxy-D-manno-octulosonate 8-phosphate phosphatase (KDO 8-P phosphatase)
MKSYKEMLPAVKAFLFDVDGVFTNSSIILHPSGEFLRTMNVRDGYAVKLAAKKGYKIGVITGGKSETVRLRFKDLGVSDVYLGIENKKAALEDFLSRHGLSAMECLYMGDDIPDYEVMRMCGMAVAPADAAEEIKGISHYISPREGGKGCVRDIVEQVLRVQGAWFDIYTTSI